MVRRRQINAEPGERGLRSLVAALGTRAGDLVGAFEERVLWRITDLLRAAGDVVGWPLERLAWTLERRLVWPLRERTAALGPPPRAAGAGALAALAVGVVAIGAALTLGGDDGEGGEERLATAKPVVAAVPTPKAGKPEPSGPVLQGVPPQFGVGKGVGVATAKSPEAENDASSDSPATAKTEAGPGGGADGGEEEAGATASSRKPVPAGPAAMKVARRFSEAFVFYEVGERPARAQTVFEETATPQLAEALAERPPRQPQSTEVPKARVLNLVPGPRHGKVYTVSASLLRVGVTSELRLKMAARGGAWRVTDVRG